MSVGGKGGPRAAASVPACMCRLQLAHAGTPQEDYPGTPCTCPVKGAPPLGRLWQPAQGGMAHLHPARPAPAHVCPAGAPPPRRHPRLPGVGHLGHRRGVSGGAGQAGAQAGVGWHAVQQGTRLAAGPRTVTAAVGVVLWWRLLSPGVQLRHGRIPFISASCILLSQLASACTLHCSLVFTILASTGTFPASVDEMKVRPLRQLSGCACSQRSPVLNQPSPAGRPQITAQQRARQPRSLRSMPCAAPWAVPPGTTTPPPLSTPLLAGH